MKSIKSIDNLIVGIKAHADAMLKHHTKHKEIQNNQRAKDAIYKAVWSSTLPLKEIQYMIEYGFEIRASTEFIRSIGKPHPEK